MKAKIALVLLSLLLLAGCAHSAAALPDLEILDAEPITDGVKITIKNSGTGDASEFKLGIELSKDGNPVGDFKKKVSGVKAGAEKVVETTFSGSEYGLGYAKVDYENKIAESNEDNNEFGF